MKKYLFVFLFIASGLKVAALPIGNPSESKMIAEGILWDGNNLVTFGDYFFNPLISWFDVLTLRGGYYGDFVFNRHLSVSPCQEESIEKTAFYTNAGYLVLNFFENLDIFGTLGETKLAIQTNAKSFGSVPGRRFTLISESDFSWSVGGRLVIFDCACTYFGLEAQYFNTRPEIKRVTLGETESLYLDHRHMHAKYHEWQLGFGVAQRINQLVPYVAMKWSTAKLNFDRRRNRHAFSPTDSFQFHSLETKNCVGYAVGLSFVDCEKSALTVEGRWGDETALYINGQVRF